MVAVCKFFNAGKCRDGDLCHFSHAILHRSSHPSSDGSNISSLRLQGSAVSSNPCSFFLRGRCTKGSACTFSHDALATATTTPAGPAVPLEDATDSRGGISCTFYAKGKCGKGNACPYAHVGGIVQAPAATPHTSAAEVSFEQRWTVFCILTQISRCQGRMKVLLRRNSSLVQWLRSKTAVKSPKCRYHPTSRLFSSTARQPRSIATE